MSLAGRTFGRWTVVRALPTAIGVKTTVLCRCACGVERAVRASRLLAGASRSCGCLASDRARRRRPWARRKLTGLRVGRLLVVRPAPAVPSRAVTQPLGRTAWFCRCDCGREVVVPTADLTRKKNPTRSCGCAKLRPLASAAVVTSPAEAPSGEAHDVPERVTTAQQWLDRQHDEQSPLGRVRRVCEPVTDEDDGIGHALGTDFDPWV